MRILLVTPCFPPQNNIASLRVHAFARYWAAAGEDVTVLTTRKRAEHVGLDLPCDGFETIECDFAVPAMLERLRVTHKTHEDGARDAGSTNHRPSRLVGAVQRFRAGRGIYSAVRMPDLSDYWVGPATTWALEHGPFDVVVSSSGPYTAHLVALNLRLRGGAARWAADFRDLWTQNHMHRGLFPFTMRERMLERRCLRKADLVSTVSEGLRRRLAAEARGPVEIIYNGFEPGELAALDARPAFPADGMTRLVHTGTLYPPGHDPMPLLEALAWLREHHPAEGAKLRLVLAGQRLDVWTEPAARLGIESMLDVRHMIPRDDALRMQRDADGLVFVDWRNPDEGVLTGKLFEYLSATAPILVVGSRAGSPIVEMVASAHAGIACDDRVETIADAVLSVVRRDATVTGARDQAFIGTFTRERQSLALLDRLRGGWESSPQRTQRTRRGE